ncbi:hypothetical protein [Clostridium sp. CCUG 7971]|uniref:hypothetical protein n=1 Tax=Clostridium sp. CCUG 7971 TaxID=2811414 RepID=UPI001ABB5C9C|nr:hypothetical protein [Clostridium sp. CCUG 7971]MBO3444288.1 hypothetical protein [Clostridium sp. CCUG 7971]
MKKPLLLGLVISLVLGVTACSSGSEEKKESTKENPQNEQVLENKSNKEEKFIYGKVKSIVGNEIEFELAKNPEKDIQGIEKEEIEKEEIKGESQPAASVAPAMNKEDGQKVNVGDIEKNEPLVELEFTGDLKTITIPTGVNIKILSARSGEGIAAIKEGTYLKLSVDDNKSEKPTVLSVDVIS